MTTRKGPERLRLEKYLKNADPDGVGQMIMSLNQYNIRVNEAAKILEQAAKKVTDGLQGQTAETAAPRFLQSSEAMSARSERVTPANSSLVTTSITMSQAIQKLLAMGDVPSDPPPTDPTVRYTPEGEKAEAARNAEVAKNQAAYEEQEKQAKAVADGMDTQFEETIVEMKKIHGIPDPPTPPGPGSPQGPVGGGNGNSGTQGPKGQVGPTNNNGVLTVHQVPQVNPVNPVIPNETGGLDNTGIGNTGGENDISTPVVRNPVDPFSGVQTEGVGSGAPSGSGGGLSGPATAGIIGGGALGVGALGAMVGKGLAAKGVSMPSLSAGAAGKIGATARSAGAAVTGRAGAGAAGAGARGGAGGSGAGGRGGAGAGAGRGSAGRGGAGGRGAGAGSRGAGGRGGAGAGAGRGGKRDKGKRGDVWDGVEDGDQWLDDDAAGGAVLE